MQKKAKKPEPQSPDQESTFSPAVKILQSRFTVPFDPDSSEATPLLHGIRNPELSAKNGIYYPESIAKVNNTLVQVGNRAHSSEARKPGLPGMNRADIAPEGGNAAKNYSRALRDKVQLPRCSGLFLQGRCKNGTHNHIKAIVCGREWCPDCGQSGSIVHNRRVARWYGKYMSLKKVGYMVITVPSELRDQFRDKTALKDFRNYVTRKLKRMKITGESTCSVIPYCYRVKKTGKLRTGMRKSYSGYKRGFIRYHWAGDCKQCSGRGCLQCQWTGAENVFKPHLNCFIPEGYMKPSQLEKLKRDVALWMQKYFYLNYTPKHNIYYQYLAGDKPGDIARKVHRLRYVTRATWRFYSQDICGIIKGFRSSVSWGKFDLSAELDSHTSAAEKGVCKCCLEATGELVKIDWHNRLRRDEAEVIALSYRHIENGYYISHLDIDQVLKN